METHCIIQEYGQAFVYNLDVKIFVGHITLGRGVVAAYNIAKKEDLDMVSVTSRTLCERGTYDENPVAATR